MLMVMVTGTVTIDKQLFQKIEELCWMSHFPTPV
jgi:hypothetical protein